MRGYGIWPVGHGLCIVMQETRQLRSGKQQETRKGQKGGCWKELEPKRLSYTCIQEIMDTRHGYPLRTEIQT